MFFAQLNYTTVQEAVLFLSTASPYCVRLSKHFELGSLSSYSIFPFPADFRYSAAFRGEILTLSDHLPSDSLSRSSDSSSSIEYSRPPAFIKGRMQRPVCAPAILAVILRQSCARSSGSSPVQQGKKRAPGMPRNRGTSLRLSTGIPRKAP